jgi:hypothetical protein
MQVGVRSKPRSIPQGMNPGLLGLPSRARSYRPALKTQSPEPGGGCRGQPNLLDRLWFSLHQLRSCPPKLIAWNRALPFGVFSPPSAGFRSRRYRHRLSMVQRLIPLSTHPQPVQQHRPLPHHPYHRSLLRILPLRSQSRNPYRRRSVSSPNGPKI